MIVYQTHFTDEAVEAREVKQFRNSLIIKEMFIATVTLSYFIIMLVILDKTVSSGYKIKDMHLILVFTFWNPFMPGLMYK